MDAGNFGASLEKKPLQQNNGGFMEPELNEKEQMFYENFEHRIVVS